LTKAQNSLKLKNIRNWRFEMKKWVSLCGALAVLLAFSFGCASSSKEKGIKCPKCGYYFQSQEGADWFKGMGYE
jgi:hypothetical protein